jgi:micrococcal nuclease
MFLGLPRALRIALLLLALPGLPGSAAAAEVLPGPYRASVEKVVDGDTLAVRVTVWLGQDLRVLVRVRGVDAPELRGECAAEKARARNAQAALARLVSGGPVVLTAIEGDKYYGRVIADVTTSAGDHVGLALISGGFVRPYDGAARSGWCEIGATEPRGRVAGIIEQLRRR